MTGCFIRLLLHDYLKSRNHVQQTLSGRLGLSGSAFAQSTPTSTNGNVQGSGTTSTGAAGQQATGMTRPAQSTTEVNGASTQPGSTMTGPASGTTTNGTRKTRSGKSGRGKMKVKSPR